LLEKQQLSHYDAQLLFFTCVLSEHFGNTLGPSTTEDKKEQHQEEKVKQ